MIEHSPQHGAGDIYCLGPPDLDRLLTAVVVLASLRSDKGVLTDRVTVILPPAAVGRIDEAGVRDGLAPICAELSGNPVSSTMEAWLGGHVEVVTMPDLQISSLVDALRGLGPRAVAVVAAAAQYRDPAVAAEASAALRQFEDIWTVHLTAAAERCLAVCQETGAYVLLDAGEHGPTEQDNLDRLMSVDGCGVLSGDRAPNFLTENLANWSALIDAGRIGAVLAGIEALELGDLAEGRLKVQMMSRAGLHAPAMEHLKAQLVLETDLPADIGVSFARAAQSAGDDALAAELIRMSAPGLVSQEHLDAALLMSDEISDPALIELVAGRLRTLFPGSPSLADMDIVRAIGDRDYDTASQRAAVAGRPEDERFYDWLANALRRHLRETAALMVEADAEWPARRPFIAAAAAREAEHLRDYAEAVRIRLEHGSEADHTPSEMLQLIRLMRLRLLRADPDDARLDDDFAAVVEAAFFTLANHPDHSTLRARLGGLLSAEASGSLGPAAAAFAILNLMGAPLAVVPAEHYGEFNGTIDALLRKAEVWLRSEPMMAIGRMTFPIDELPDDFDPTIDRILVRALERAGDTLAEESDVEAVLRMTGLIGSLAPHLRDPDTDIVAIRTTAIKLVISGRAQRARDLIETVLLIAGDRPERHRLAWFAYGDVYLRTGDRNEALVAIGAGLASFARIPTDQAWSESQAVTRLLRDMGLQRHARGALERGSRVLEASSLLEANQGVIDAMNLQIDLREIEQSGEVDPAALEAFLGKAVETCRTALDFRPEIAPMATLLGQAIRIARAIGLALPADAEAVLEEAIFRVGEPLASDLRIYNADVPSADNLATLAKRLDSARYASDAGFDLVNLALLARRYLGGSADAGDPRLAAYAIELLSDQTLAIEPDHGAGVTTPSEPDVPLSAAIAISKTGLGVALLGMDEQSRLVRCQVVDGSAQAPVVETETTFSDQAFDAWRRTYPYGYGFIGDRQRDANDRINPAPDLGNFMQTMKGLGVMELPPQRCVLVLDTSLQSLPANVLKVGEAFAAQSTAMAVAPSLSWLKHAALTRGRTGGPRQAWISTAFLRQEGAALATMAERLAPTFAKHEIRLETSAAISPGLAGAELAIVGAHGAVHERGGRFFNAVHDEGGQALRPEQVARAVTGAKVVILFVCSGARLDNAPIGRGSVGLAHRLLDQGCAAVVGSPWPVSASVPVYWLPTFLEAWEAGLPVIDANHYANEAVSRHLGTDPEVTFAMHVYGDPLVAKS